MAEGKKVNQLTDMKNKLLVEQTRDRIFHYILNLEMEVGTKLPNEFVLAEQFAVGRSTIREAVKQLVSQGILSVKQGSGTYVASLTPVDQDPLGLRAVKDKMKLAWDLVNVRMILEPEIAELAALNATAEDVEKLRELCDEVEGKINNEEAYVQADISFHIGVASCTKNIVMEQLIPIIDTAVMMFVNVTHQQLKKETVMTHRMVTEAIASRDALGAKSAMGMHIGFNRDLIGKLMQERKEQMK